MPDPGDVELVRLGRIGRRLRVAIVAVVVLLLGAAIKPWPGGSAGARESVSNDPGPPGSGPTLVVAGASRVVPETSLSPEEAVAAGLCENPDGWRVVSDDVELGRQVRTWLTAEVVYSSAPPTPASIPVTTLVSAGISRLGFCRPPDFAQTGQETWTGSIWRQAATPAAQASSWQLVGRLTPPAGLDRRRGGPGPSPADRLAAGPLLPGGRLGRIGVSMAGRADRGQPETLTFVALTNEKIARRIHRADEQHEHHESDAEPTAR